MRVQPLIAGEDRGLLADECVRLCHVSREACARALAHSLLRGGPLAATTPLRALLDCADLCRAASDLVLRSSPHALPVVAACADASEACGRICESFLDDEMLECAQSCHATARACENLAEILS